MNSKPDGGGVAWGFFTPLCLDWAKMSQPSKLSSWRCKGHIMHSFLESVRPTPSSFPIFPTKNALEKEVV